MSPRERKDFHPLLSQFTFYEKIKLQNETDICRQAKKCLLFASQREGNEKFVG
jgi:hypothetical protein